MVTIGKETAVCASCRYWGWEHYYIASYKIMISAKKERIINRLSSWHKPQIIELRKEIVTPKGTSIMEL